MDHVRRWDICFLGHVRPQSILIQKDQGRLVMKSPGIFGFFEPHKHKPWVRGMNLVKALISYK